LLQRCGHRENEHRNDGGDIGFENAEWTDARNPHHGGRGVADHAAGPTRVRGRDDRGEIADMDLALKHMPRNRPADQGGRDVVEEARQHEYQEQQGHAPFQSSAAARAFRPESCSPRSAGTKGQIPSATGTD